MKDAAQTIGIVGMGLMGRGIASCLLLNNFRVIAFTRPAETLPEARRAIASDIEDAISHGAAPATLDWSSRHVEAKSVAEFGDCDIVIESVIEDLATKRAVFAEIESTVARDVPIGTNTSAIPITTLQEGRLNPARIVGLHFCPPVHVNRFMEIIRGEHTDDATVQRAIDLAVSMDKEPGIVRKDVEGFVVNRIAYAMFREALHLIESGVADAETIDRCFRNVIGMWGGIMGPLRWMDLTGLPAYVAVMKRLLPKLSNTTEVPPIIEQLVARHETFHRNTPQEIQRWQELLREHAWAMRDLSKKYFPEQDR